jgi:HNH endonuclease
VPCSNQLSYLSVGARILREEARIRNPLNFLALSLTWKCGACGRCNRISTREHGGAGEGPAKLPRGHRGFKDSDAIHRFFGSDGSGQQVHQESRAANGVDVNADDARRQLLANGWSLQSLHVWGRAGGRCEYCARDLLACEDAHFFGSEIDHIVPDGTEGEYWDNLALACKVCNRVRRNRRFTDSEVVLTRAEKISRAAGYIADIRGRNRIRLKDSREWLGVVANFTPQSPTS